jgi:hypothetical protein
MLRHAGVKTLYSVSSRSYNLTCLRLPCTRQAAHVVLNCTLSCKFSCALKNAQDGRRTTIGNESVLHLSSSASPDLYSSAQCNGVAAKLPWLRAQVRKSGGVARGARHERCELAQHSKPGNNRASRESDARDMEQALVAPRSSPRHSSFFSLEVLLGTELCRGRLAERSAGACCQPRRRTE